MNKLLPQTVINLGKHLPKAVLANLKYDFPGKKLKVIGVTGTDGKTTTVNMIYKILLDSHKKVSMISTVNAIVGGKIYDTGFHVTSPDSGIIQKLLSDAVKNGDEYFILEVTSHALEQFRVWGIPFEIGVITNITHEHLDYHKTFQKYLRSKIKLIKNTRTAVLNYDDENYQMLKSSAKKRVISFGLNQQADVNPINCILKLAIPGKYNQLNALASVAVAKELGINNEQIIRSLNSLKGIIGRMEEIKNNRDIKIVVDFAHTPNALQLALLTLRESTKGKLISVFGCAGERDTEKRPMMGKISARLADLTILTDEDPRFESNLGIIDQISSGARSAGARLNENLLILPDREKAIRMALSFARRGDVIGIFGKGHEQSMSYQGKELTWSDVQTVKDLLNE